MTGVEIVVESGVLTVEPIAANVALPGPERTVLELYVTVGAGARLILEDAPLVVAAGADVIRTTTIRLGPGAVAIVRDVVILGRAGEGPGRLESRAALSRGFILHDALRVEPDTFAQDAYVALAPGHRAIGTYTQLGVPGIWHGPGHLERTPHRARPMSRQHVRRGDAATERGCERSASVPRDLRDPSRRGLRVLRAQGAAR